MHHSVSRVQCSLLRSLRVSPVRPGQSVLLLARTGTPIRRNMSTGPASKPQETTGILADLNAKIGGILGLAGAPTFTRGENVIKLITKDHREVEAEYEKYKKTTDKKVKQEAAWNITKMLVQHAEVEQMLVYPLLKMRNIGNNGQSEHDRSLNEHQECRELLYKLDNTSIDDPSHASKLDAVMKANSEHVAAEEKDVLPLIEKNYTAEELERVGSAFTTHKYTAPTHPHPSAPMQGPLAAVAGMAAKPLDLARDAARKVTTQK